MRHWLLTIGFLMMSPLFAHAQENDAKRLADAIRDFNSAFGDVTDGNLTPDQINQYERMIAPMMDIDVHHKNQCGLVSFSSATLAGLILAWSQPATAALYAEKLADIRAKIVPGSLQDWLVQFATPLITPLGSERTIEATLHQCLNQPFVHAAFPDLPIGSPEMAKQEQCLVHRICADD